MRLFLRIGLLVGPMVLLGFSCAKKAQLRVLSAQDSVQIVRDNLAHRAAKDRYFAKDPGSPFRTDTTIAFRGLHWFPVDPRYSILAMLHRYENPETVTVMGTKGEERRHLRYGWFEFTVPDANSEPALIRVNVYTLTPSDKRLYGVSGNPLSVWFTDRTTGQETYHVGRYVDVGEEHADAAHLYTIDLNKAYNPFCAYNDAYSCAIPREEDRIGIALRVGEKPYREDP